MKAAGALVVHSGGPTAVLNASLAGLIDAFRELPGRGRLLGARFGVAGLVAGDWIDLTDLAPDRVAAIRTAPGSVLGSSRQKLDADGAEKLAATLRERGVEWLLYTGGNGSMQTALLLHRVGTAVHPGLRVIGVPKTIDNDLAVTDHTPGYGSAARFFAHALRDIGEDNRGLPPPVQVVEVLGRNAGWIVAATALARGYPDDAPHLIYCPERPPTLEKICSDVQEVCGGLGRAVVAVCEGLRDPGGRTFGAEVDRPGSKQHELAMNLGYTLARAITARTGLRARAEKPGLLGRSSALAVSEVDAAESYQCGYEAVRAASAGHAGVMVALRRISQTPYESETFLTPLAEVAGIERGMPAEYLAASGNDVTAEFLEYVRPLVGEVRPHGRL
jgi:6-phosphofructokinase 1